MSDQLYNSDTNTNNNYEIKSCNCSFCSQFYFARVRKYNNKHKKISNKNDTTETPKQFTLKDFDTISNLKSLGFNNKEISEKSNLPKSLVDYIIEKITYK